MKNQAILTVSILLNLMFLISSFTVKTINPTITNTTQEISIVQVMMELNEYKASVECRLEEQENTIEHLKNIIENQNNTIKNIEFAFATSSNIEKQIQEMATVVQEKTVDVVTETVVEIADNNTIEEEILFGQSKQVNKKTSYDAALIDKIDDIYFETVNETKGINDNRKDELTDYIIEMEKDLEAFTVFTDFVHPETIKAKAREVKIKNAKVFKSENQELRTNNYYSSIELNNYLGAKLIDKTFSGFCINLIVSDEMLPVNHSIFQSFGKLKMEKTENDEYRYFINGFKSQKSANQFLENIVLPRYSDAAVTFYKKGKKKSNLWQLFFAPIR